MTSPRAFLLPAVFFALAACGGRDGGPDGDEDAGGGVDSGPTPGIDSGPAPGVDSGPTPGVDAGPTPGVDAGPPADTGPPGRSCGGFGGGRCAAGEFCNYAIEDICGAADATGVCTPIPSACTRELNPVCGCDGMDYSNPCLAHMAGTSVASRGMCMSSGGGAVCTAPVLCDALPPMCPDGQVPSIMGGCWGPCVPITSCYCDARTECPPAPRGSEPYTCDRATMRCR